MGNNASLHTSEQRFILHININEHLVHVDGAVRVLERETATLLLHHTRGGGGMVHVDPLGHQLLREKRAHLSRCRRRGCQCLDQHTPSRPCITQRARAGERAAPPHQSHAAAAAGGSTRAPRRPVA
jgi:hypothetical protein